MKTPDPPHAPPLRRGRGLRHIFFRLECNRRPAPKTAALRHLPRTIFTGDDSPANNCLADYCQSLVKVGSPGIPPPRVTASRRANSGTDAVGLQKIPATLPFLSCKKGPNLRD